MEKVVKPYNESDSKKGQVSKMFDSIAPYYDFLNRLLSLGIDTIWRTKAIAEIKTNNPARVLDIATGTADLALEINKQLPNAKITGVDISKEMLEIGKQKIKKRKLENVIHLELGDSENLPFEDDSFDAVSVAFGVRNFENLLKGLQEMHRVLKPGGQVMVLEFSRPTIFPFKQLFNFYFKNILPFIGRFTSKDPRAYQYLYESVQAFPDGEDFLTVLKQAGFEQSSNRPLTFGVCSIYKGVAS